MRSLALAMPTHSITSGIFVSSPDKSGELVLIDLCRDHRPHGQTEVRGLPDSELLQGVTQRYQPNVGMTKLAKIKTGTLEEIIPKVTEVFEEACRYIDGHSQPLITLGVSPTLTGLEQHWVELQALQKKDDTGT